MIISWLKTNFLTNTPNNLPKTMHHAILGNVLKAPLGNNQEEILFGCGCFWGAEKGFWRLPGVITTAVGYAGGVTEEPTYNKVCSGKTGYAEVVRVTWDKSVIDVSDLLKLFWECHDPTQGNRQGNDRGTQYRSAIYTTTEDQMKLATSSLQQYQEDLTNKGFGVITTEVKQNQIFYFAEEYHQQYLAKPGSRPYCSAMPTQVPLKQFKGARFKLPNKIWTHFDWSINHCILRSNNDPIKDE